MEFCRYTSPDPDHPFDAAYSLYDVQPHHRLIAEAIDRVMKGEIQYLAISMPPQVGKSETCVRKFLPFHIGKYPWKHLIVGTYSSTFAEEHGDDVRTMINSEPYQRVFPHVALRQGSKAKDHMVTTRGGKVSFIGREGAGSGRPADGLLVDDLLKDDKEAASKTIRDASWNWYTRVAENRCHSMSWRIVIATRWSDDDLIARLTDPKNPYYDESVAKEWTVINIPNIMDNADIAKALGKKVGDVLWPERFSLELLKRRQRMDPVGFSAMHQGRPTPPDGSFYKQSMLTLYQHPSQYPKKVIQYMTGDLAVSKESRADKTCIGIWGLDENDELWLHWDLHWQRSASDEIVDQIIKMGSSYLIMDSWFEKGQLDKAIGPFLDKAMQEDEAYFSITRLPVSGNKGLKSKSIQGRMAQRKVHFPDFAPWWENAKEQMLKFTGSGDDKSDDFCDMIALIGQGLGGQTKPNSGHSNIVQFPKAGSFGWTKWAANRERKAAQNARLMRGV